MNYEDAKPEAPGPERIAYLVAGFIKKTLTPSEHDELDAWVEASDENMLLFEEMTDEKQLQSHLNWMDTIDTNAALQQVVQQIQFAKPVQQKRSKKLWLYSIAATLLLAIVGFYLVKQWSGNAKTTTNGIAKNEENIMPAVASVTLTLSNGKQVALDQVNNNWQGNDAGTALQNDSGMLRYKNPSAKETDLANTLTTGAGSTYHVLLSDGTKVWLNAGSSLTYPVNFGNDARVVVLTGEGYFEVATTGKPFTVNMDEQSSVLVKGTQFNIKHYSDENDKKVTLVEGSVQVQHHNKTSILTPGEEADISAGTIQITDADIDEATGWRKDLFVFKDAPVENIMQAVKRWYDIQVVYEHKGKPLFNATISRKEPLSRLLHLLELTGKIHFTTKSNKVYVH